jgi:hypothetical protein
MNPFIPSPLVSSWPPVVVGRSLELEQVGDILKADGDLLLTGVPGIGRRTLVRSAARQVGARVVEIDCLRATDYLRFLQLLGDAILVTFSQPMELSLIHTYLEPHLLQLDTSNTGRAKLLIPSGLDDWVVFKRLLALPQVLAESMDCRVVLVFQNFPHIRSWDRSNKWEDYLRQKIQVQTRVSYAIIATMAQKWTEQTDMKTVFLAPVADADLRSWLVTSMRQVELSLDQDAIQLVLDSVQGHFGDALALSRRIWLEHRGKVSVQVRSHQVYRSSVSLIEDLSVTFESLILLLPSTQVRVLECLALDPTDSPHANEYLKKHNLSRGGTLQGALLSLEQKGLVYGPDRGYKIALPMLGLWLRYRLG